MKINSMGTFTTATEFVPLFTEKQAEFIPFVIRRIDYEDCKIKTKEPTSGLGYEAQSGVTPQNQQTNASEAE